MSFWNLAILPGIQVNRTKLNNAGFQLHNHFLLYKYIFVAFSGKEGNKFDPRSLLLCMTMNKSIHERLIRNTGSTVGAGKNGIETIFQSASSSSMSIFVSHMNCRLGRAEPTRGILCTLQLKKNNILLMKCQVHYFLLEEIDSNLETLVGWCVPYGSEDLNPKSLMKSR